METISAIVAALSSIKTATEIVKLLKASDDAYIGLPEKGKSAQL